MLTVPITPHLSSHQNVDGDERSPPAGLAAGRRSERRRRARAFQLGRHRQPSFQPQPCFQQRLSSLLTHPRLMCVVPCLHSPTSGTHGPRRSHGRHPPGVRQGRAHCHRRHRSQPCSEAHLAVAWALVRAMPLPPTRASRAWPCRNQARCVAGQGGPCF